MTTTPESQTADRGPRAHYFARLAQGNFEIQRCDTCARHQFFPRVMCMHCGSTGLRWITPAGTGTVYSVSVILAKPEHGGDRNVALIDLDEGVRMMSRVDGIALHEIRIGMKVRARVLPGDSPLVVFEPTEAA